MAKKQMNTKEYEEFLNGIKTGELKNLYVFFGEERYLLEYYLGRVRAMVPKGTEEFNHRKFDGKTLQMRDLSEAVDALPVFSETTLTEICDFDFSKLSESASKELFYILSDLPEYARVIFVCREEFKLDGRSKQNAALKKLFTQVDFRPQAQDDLVKWIVKHARAGEKNIDRAAAEYLAFVCGGLMTNLNSEMQKLISYSKSDAITRKDIDAVVTPVLDAAAYELTDAIVLGDYEKALKKLGELFAMDEAPHRILYSVSEKMRQLLGARVLMDEGRYMAAFMEIFEIKHEFQAKRVYFAAGKLKASRCAEAVKLCSDTAYRLNSGGDGKGLLSQLVANLAVL